MPKINLWLPYTNAHMCTCTIPRTHMHTCTYTASLGQGLLNFSHQYFNILIFVSHKVTVLLTELKPTEVGTGNVETHGND